MTYQQNIVKKIKSCVCRELIPIRLNLLLKRNKINQRKNGLDDLSYDNSIYLHVKYQSRRSGLQSFFFTKHLFLITASLMVLVSVVTFNDAI